MPHSDKSQSLPSENHTPFLSSDNTWWEPLKVKVFRMLWLAWMTSNICMWMNDVAASWLMTSLSDSPTMVALVQTASNLPVFLLGLPSGAFADILNRKKYFVFTQIWVASNAALLFVLAVGGYLNASILLLLTFINGIGLAMRWPVFAAVVPDLVPREKLPAALALNGVAMNVSRIVGPLVAGALIAGAGTEYVFALNMILSLMCTILIFQWKYEANVSTLPGERFLGAIRVGLQFVRSSERLRAVLIRVFIFFIQTSALLALIPIIAKQHFNGNAKTFTIMLSCMGVGAIIAATQLPRLRGRLNRQQLVNMGQILQGLCSIGIVLSPNLWIAAPLIVLNGMGWITAANSLSLSAQYALPSWIRARGMSMFQMSLMSGSALGAALWGKIASETNVTTSVIAGTVFGLASILFTRRMKLEGGIEEDLTPVCPIEHPMPSREIDPLEGPVMISIQYHIEPRRMQEFQDVMKQSRSARLRHGAISWSLFEDAEKEGMIVEYFVFENWADYLRRFDRFTTNDLNLQEERFSFHIDKDPPTVTRRVATTLKE